MTTPVFRDRAALETHQLDRLRRLLAALREGNPFYGERLRRAGVDGHVESLDAFAAAVPLTTKREIAADQADHPPYGSNLTHPLDRYVRLHQTSSTTGAPLRWLDTAESWDEMVEGWVEVLAAAGITARDRLFAAFSFGPFIGFWLGFEAAARMGCLVIPGGALSSVNRLKAILANDVNVLCCTPTYAVRLGETARAEGVDLAASPVRTIVVGGEPGGSIPAARDRIESLWPGARVFDHHGMTEIGPATFQCPDRVGTLHLLESSLLCEFVDPETGGPPAADDAVCELVVTTLHRVGSPLLRYRTGDLVRPAPPDACACGRVSRRLEGGVVGRLDDMVFVRGVNVYPSTVDQVVRSHAGVAEYQVEIREERGMTELRILLEPAPGCPDADALRAAVSEEFRTLVNLRVPVELVDPGSLPRFEFKSRRWVRRGPGIPA
ncbi:MAG: phenylacetate--CoA ligase family protein [Planctomycetota bacterium]|jgi:phenylacetate-CoA ligase